MTYIVRTEDGILGEFPSLNDAVDSLMNAVIFAGAYLKIATDEDGNESLIIEKREEADEGKG